MRTKRFLIGVLAAPTLLLGIGGGIATAGTIYQGGDYSYTTSGHKRPVICDMEADARTAYVLWEAGNYNISGRVNDMDGSSGSCWMTTYDIATNVMFHKTCEDINNWPDACSKWYNHY